MGSSTPPISAVLPPLFLGTAAFNTQYNHNPYNLPISRIITRFLASSSTYNHPVGFDTSPYYGPAELLLGNALSSLDPIPPRSSYLISTKVGRIASDEFDYSPSWIRHSIARSLRRLKTEHVDIVYLHDVEFVSEDEVLTAVGTLRELRAEGKIRYIGISGYPVDILAGLAERILETTGEPLDVVMSYANCTVQNERLLGKDGVGRFEKAGVGCVLNGSPLGMGLLRSQGVPVGSMGDFHPSSDGLRAVCAEASKVVEGKGGKLEEVAYRWALEKWAEDGGVVGTATVEETGRVGASVIGVSFQEELESILETWGDVLDARNGKAKATERKKENLGIVEELKGVFGEHLNAVWDSPGKDFERKTPPPERRLGDDVLWPELVGGINGDRGD